MADQPQKDAKGAPSPDPAKGANLTSQGVNVDKVSTDAKGADTSTVEGGIGADKASEDDPMGHVDARYSDTDVDEDTSLTRGVLNGDDEPAVHPSEVFTREGGEPAV